MIARILTVFVAALVLAGPAAAATCAHPKTSLPYLEGQVMCPICHTTLDQSDSAAARQIENHITVRIDECWTTKQIETELVGIYGKGILAAPPDSGFDVLAWWLPIAGVLGGAVILGFGVWRWSRKREAEPEPAGSSGLDEETERRLDEVLARFE